MSAERICTDCFEFFGGEFTAFQRMVSGTDQLCVLCRSFMNVYFLVPMIKESEEIHGN